MQHLSSDVKELRNGQVVAQAQVTQGFQGLQGLQCQAPAPAPPVQGQSLSGKQVGKTDGENAWGTPPGFLGSGGFFVVDSLNIGRNGMNFVAQNVEGDWKLYD